MWRLMPQCSSVNAYKTIHVLAIMAESPKDK